MTVSRRRAGCIWRATHESEAEDAESPADPKLMQRPNGMLSTAQRGHMPLTYQLHGISRKLPPREVILIQGN